MSDFADKIVLVTGGTRGIGRACVELFAREGAKVAMCGRNAEHTADVAQQIGGDVHGYGCHMSNSEEVNALVAAVTKDLGPVQILINNAGITQDGLLMRMKDEEWANVLDTNLSGMFYACRAAARGMLRQRYGRIINMSSIIGIHGQAGQTNYAASKAGIIGFSKAYAREVASRNITVNVVAPGYIKTDMTAALGDDTMKAVLDEVPMLRPGKPEEIATVAAFLASPAADYITGAVLNVDGGLGM